MSAELLEAALDYAKRGFHVFPCEPRGKKPLTPNGFKDATTDASTIRAMWARDPLANVAIATEASGLAVVDVDVKSGGVATFDEMRRELGLDTFETITANTPGGGQHLFYRAPDGTKPAVRSGVQLLGPGVDIRASGGYVVAAPSVGANGVAYRWLEGLSPQDGEAKPWPMILTQKISARSKPTLLPSREVDVIVEGGRNVTLARFAGAMRRSGLNADEILASLEIMNENRCKPPLLANELQTIARSVSRYTPEAPIITGAAQKGFGSRKHTVVKASDVTEEAVNWLWEYRIPLGSITAFVGTEEVGKTFLYVALASYLSTGRLLPDSEAAIVCDTLIWAGEDRKGRIVERARKCGADLERLHILNEEPGRESIAWLDTFLTDHPQVKLLVLDPVTSFLYGADSNDDTAVRQCFTGLQKLAEKHMIAVVFLRHLNKNREAPIKDRVLGARAFVAIPRSVLYLGEHLGTRRKAIFQIKNNDDERADAIGFSIDSSGFTFGAIDSGLDADAYARSVADPTKPKPLTNRNMLLQWIRQTLAEGPMPSPTFLALAKSAGYSERSLKRYKAAAGATSAKGSTIDASWFWYLESKGAMEETLSPGVGTLRFRSGPENAETRVFVEEGQYTHTPCATLALFAEETEFGGVRQEAATGVRI